VSTSLTHNEEDSAPAEDEEEGLDGEEYKTPYGRNLRQDDPPAYVQVAMDEQTLQDWVSGYESDRLFKRHWKSKLADLTEALWYAGHCFYKDSRKLLFFRDADFVPKLCVSYTQRAALLISVHKEAGTTTHAGAHKLYAFLQDRFYWPTMKKDVERFCKTCDVCQKIKPLNFGKFGYLQPNPIPASPYESVLLDLIGPLPESDGSTAILVIVDWLSKHAQFISTVLTLNTKGFAHLFVKHVSCRHGLPESIFADRDGRWFSGFWRLVSKQMQVRMAL
jgi:hypothetical protein